MFIKMTTVLIAIYLIINIVSFLLMGIDKRKAIKGKERISEKTLLLSAFLMGGLGSFFGAHVFRHKTQKLKFQLLLPLAVLCNAAVIYLIVRFIIGA